MRYLPLLLLLSCAHMNKVAWVLSTNPREKNSESLKNGENIYRTHCLSCHGADLSGNGPEGKKFKIPPANLKQIAQKRFESTFAAHIAYGKTGNPDMPQFVDTLKKEDIWDVTNYVYSLK